MRDPNRIPGNWEKVAELHSRFPDWRMSQFLINLFREMENDPFYMEDAEFLDLLDDIVSKWRSKNEIKDA